MDTQDTQQDTPLSVAFDRMCDVLAEAYRRSEEKRDK